MSVAAKGTILLIGAGKMGGALLAGWIAQGWAARLAVIDPAPGDRLRALGAEHGFQVATNAGGMTPPDVMVLAIKPQMLDAAASTLAHLCRPDMLLVSILAGKTIGDLASRLPAKAIVRAMPNTPAGVSQAITDVFAGPHVDDEHRALAAALLSAVGGVEWLAEEALIDAVTAVSGSGPAYVFQLVECLAGAARAVGLDQRQAERFARATVIGASALLAAEPDTGADQLRRNVTSPGGTTAAALAVLNDDDALAGLIRRAVVAARDRARELSG